jgi:hypothetical protein
MLIPIGEMADARALVQGLLDELGLSSYRFQLDASRDTWLIAVECPTDGSWQTVHLSLNAKTLKRARVPGSARTATKARMAERLADCDREALQ